MPQLSPHRGETRCASIYMLVLAKGSKIVFQGPKLQFDVKIQSIMVYSSIQTNMCQYNTLPHRTPVRWSHRRTWRTLKSFGKFLQIGHCANHTELSRTVRANLYTQLQHLWPVYPTPDVSRTNPKQLLWCVLEAGQRRFRTMIAHILLVRLK